MRLLLLMLALSACHNSSLDTHEKSLEVEIEEIPDDIRIPTKLWDDIEKRDEVVEAKPPEPTGDEDGLNSKSTMLFAPVTVVLKEHNPKVLTSSEIKIALPRGGGTVDLAKYMGENPGSFYVRFEWPEWSELPEVRSFYVSRAKIRKLDGEIFGAGCNKYLDLTKKIKSENSVGIKVNTTRDRHSTVLGGHFVFSAHKGQQTYLTQVTFNDSKNKGLFCDEMKTL